MNYKGRIPLWVDLVVGKSEDDVKLSEMPWERGAWERGFFWPVGGWGGSGPLALRIETPKGHEWLREGEFYTILCPAPRKRRGTRGKRNP